MDVICDRRELQRALKLVGKGVAQHPQPEVVSLAVDDEGLWVRSKTVICPPSPGAGPAAISYEIALEIEVRVEADSVAQATPPVSESADGNGGAELKPGPSMQPKILLDLVGRLEDGEVRLTGEQEKLIVRSGTYECTLPLAGWELPHPLPVIGRKHHLIIEAEELRAGLRAAVMMASKDLTRAYLCAVQMIAGRDQVRLLATDLYRLIERTLPCQGYGMREGEEWRATVPALSVAKIIEASRQGEGQSVRLRREGEPELAWGEKGTTAAGKDACPTGRSQTQQGQAGVPVLLTEVGNVRMRCGLWPRWVNPAKEIAGAEKGIRRWIECERRELLRALRRADLVAEGDSHRAILKIGQDTLEVQTDGIGLGESSESVPVELQGGLIDIAFNVRYLADGLRVLRAPRVTLWMGGELDPGVLEADGDRYIIMPMQIL